MPDQGDRPASADFLDRHAMARRQTRTCACSVNNGSSFAPVDVDTSPCKCLSLTARNEPLNIRPCTSGDRAGVVALWERVFPDNPPHNAPETMFDSKFAVGDDLLLVAEDTEIIIGTVMAGYDGHRGWLYAVAVLPEHRRRGIGTNLVRHAVEALRAVGCVKVNLQIRATNAAVRGFYESLGFEAEELLSMGLHIR